jgi:hypothetical protein
MGDFAPRERSFRAGKPERQALERLPVLMIPIDHVEATRRSLSHGVFNNGEQLAQERVLAILRGFRRGDALPPVEVVDFLTAPRARTGCTTERTASIAPSQRVTRTARPSKCAARLTVSSPSVCGVAARAIQRPGNSCIVRAALRLASAGASGACLRPHRPSLLPRD